MAPGKKKGKGRPRATPTPTPRRKTLAQVLMAGIASIAGHASADGTLSWPSVKGAARYVVVVSAPHGPVQWAWSGTSTAVHFGDTEIAGVPGTAGDGWSVPMPSAAVWSVLALDSRGSIVGLKLR